MEYESGKARRHETKNSLKVWGIVLGFLFLAGVGAATWISSGPTGWGFAERLRGAVMFYVFSREPNFYFLDGEKNGEGFVLKKGDVFELSYRDEFVFKKVSTDVLSARGISVDIHGIGSSNDLHKLLKGVDLVDRAVWSEKGKRLEKGFGESSISISYKGRVIASIPVKILITPQDWLRYAERSSKNTIKIDYLKRALALNAKDVNLRRTLASAYFKAGMTKEALEQYKVILRLKPNDGPALSALAKCYLKIGRYDEALEAAARSVKINAGEGNVLVDLAAAWAGSGNWEKAISSYREYLKVRPDDPAVLYKLGAAYQKAGELDLAVQQYKKILQKVPNADDVKLALADVFLKKEDFGGAIKLYRDVLKSQPHNAAVYANLGFAYGKKGMHSEEIACYREAIRFKPGDPVIHFNLAAALETAQKPTEAAKEYEKVLKLKADDYEALTRLADIRFMEKNYRSASLLYEKALKKNPREAQIHTRLGLCYFEMKQPDRAEKSWEKAVQLGEDNPEVIAGLAGSYLRTGNKKKATLLYAKIAARKPTAELLDKLAALYLDDKNYDQALATYKRLVKLSPKRGYSGAGYVYGLKGDTQQQIAYYKMALKYDSEDYDIYAKLGAAYEKQGLLKEALQAYTVAYQLNPDAEQVGRNIPRIKIMLLRQKH